MFLFGQTGEDEPLWLQYRHTRQMGQEEESYYSDLISSLASRAPLSFDICPLSFVSVVNLI
jgi:hypothetical protein